MKPRIYLSRALPEPVLAPLREHCELVIGEQTGGLHAGVVPESARDCEGLICLLTDQVDAALLDALPKLRFVCSISVGVDHVDVEALTQRGIALGHTPGVLVDATADTAFALLLAAGRRVAEADRFVRDGQWLAGNSWSPDFFLGKDVAGATLGIIGMGDIGQAVARRAQGFGMRVVGWNRTPRSVEGIESLAFEEVLACADYLSVHVALTEQTHGMIGAKELAQMQPGGVVINTARGGIVDEHALAEALHSGHLFAAGLDVYESEPLPADSPLLKHPRIVIAPHIGSATGQTRLAMVKRTLENCIAALQEQEMPFCFNPEIYSA